jgi:DNA mismatch endonuclease (patch repair protein)
MMSGIQKDTSPEMLVRKALFREGYRYRLHYPMLPGRPDLVLPKYRAVILVNGCFWHGHGCHLFKWPISRTDFWRKKISGNVERDRRNLAKYHEAGWRVLVIWECALKGRYRLEIDRIFRV